MKITINDASVTRIINDGQLVEEIPVAGPPPAATQAAEPETKSTKGGK